MSDEKEDPKQELNLAIELAELEIASFQEELCFAEAQVGENYVAQTPCRTRFVKAKVEDLKRKRTKMLKRKEQIEKEEKEYWDTMIPLARSRG